MKMSLKKTVAKLLNYESINVTDLFNVVEPSRIYIHSSNSRFFKIGKIVLGQIRFDLNIATTGSTKILTPKSSALKEKWYPITGIDNYYVFPMLKAWDASQSLLAFINDTWDFGIGAAKVGNYVGTLCYIVRS